MSEAKISGAAVEAAFQAYIDHDDTVETSIRAALTAALPHLHPQPAELAEPSGNSGGLVYQCPRCATSMEVDPTAKPSALSATGKQQAGEVAVAEQHVLPLAREVLAAQCRSRLEFASERDIKTGRNDANWPELEIIAHALRHPHYLERPEGGSPWKHAAQVGEVQGDALALFEAWAAGDGFDVTKVKGIYTDPLTRGAWDAWRYLAARQPGAVE